MRPLLVGLALLAALVAGMALPMGKPAPLPACPTEDSVACHWDAQHRGNGKGKSFDSDALGNITFTD